MNNRSIMVSALLMLVIAVATAGTASAAGSVVRDLPDTPVSPGEEITVGLTQDGFLFDVVVINPEVLPGGFVYVDGSYTGDTAVYDPSTNTLILALGGSGELSVTYRVTAGSAEQIESAEFRGFYHGFPIDYGMVTGDFNLTLGDEVLPTINSVELNETDVTTGDPILVTVDATDNVGVDGVTAEGVELTHSSDIWTGVIIAEEGTHTVNVCARDAAGNVAWDNSTSYTATAPDTESPVVNSVELNETDVTTGDPILVTVDATDNFGVDGVTAEGVELTHSSDIWTGVIIAEEGTHTVNVCARDAAGNVAWDNLTSYTATAPDTESPVVNSVELNETDVTTGDPILVTVDATDNVGVDGVTAEGVELTHSSDIWTGVIIAEEGTHTVNVCARDAAGNTGWNNSTSYTATAPDTESPVVNSVELNETDVTTGDPILVTVDATDNVGVDGVTAEGVELALQGGDWAGVIMAGLGENIVHVSARDAAGNVGWNNSTSYNGEWGNGPNISISITPALKNVSAGGTFTINITVDPNATAIQGAQAELIFDPNFVTVDGLSNVGEIFEGHYTYGEHLYVIDNVNGTVSNITSGIIDGGSVTSAGVLATVTLTVNGSATGDSALELNKTQVVVDVDGGTPVSPPDLVVNNGTLTIGLAMTVTATPPSVTVNNSTSVVFNVTSDSTPVVGATVTLSGAFDNVSTTGVDGTVTIEVNATSTGTINVIATKDGATAETTVTVSEAGLPQTGDIDGSGGDPTMNDAVYLAKHVVGLSGYETICADGDIDGSGGDPTMNDAVYLAKHVVGLSGYETIYP